MDVYTGRKIKTVTDLEEYTLVGEDTPFDTDVQDSFNLPANFNGFIYFNVPVRLNGLYPLLFVGMVADGYDPNVTVIAPPQVVTAGGQIEVFMRNAGGSSGATGNLRFVFAEVDKSISY